MRATLPTIPAISTWAAIVLAAALAAGCARTMHTSDGYGVANHTFFDRQAEATRAGTARGLDPEEAAAIHQRYREALGARASATGKRDTGASVLILQEGDNAGNKR